MRHNGPPGPLLPVLFGAGRERLSLLEKRTEVAGGLQVGILEKRTEVAGGLQVGCYGGVEDWTRSWQFVQKNDFGPAFFPNSLDLCRSGFCGLS